MYSVIDTNGDMPTLILPIGSIRLGICQIFLYCSWGLDILFFVAWDRLHEAHKAQLEANKYTMSFEVLVVLNVTVWCAGVRF